MKLQTYQTMREDYGKWFELDDEITRKELLAKFPHSVILEGNFMELDSLNKWIELNMGADYINWHFYGKTGYDYGFAEYFFAATTHAEQVRITIPNIYTIYPHAYPSPSIIKSNGYDEQITYNPEDKNAIVMDLTQPTPPAFPNHSSPA